MVMAKEITEIEDSSNKNKKAIAQIRKRDKGLVDFNNSKISNAIYKALMAAGKTDYKLAERLSEKVVQKMDQQFSVFDTNRVPSVEDVQDMVESILIEEGLSETAKAYILYRHERRKIRDNNNEIIEDPKLLFERVAILVTIPDILHDSELYSNSEVVVQNITEAEEYYKKIDDFHLKLKIGNHYLNRFHFESMIRHYINLAKSGRMKVSFKNLLRLIAEGHLSKYSDRIIEYYNLMVTKDFLPNTPTLMNAGAKLGQLSACFVLDMKDDMTEIMKSSTDAAIIFKSGGGVGINYSKLRPEGDIVASTSGVASGPISFMRIIDTITDVVKQGGKRRGANMGILESWHPDIEKFITMKTKPGMYENFNVSVGIWSDFWKSLVNKEDHKYSLKNPRTKVNVKNIDSHQLMELIALSAWKSAEPGVIFFDNINKYNPCMNAKG